MAHNLFGERFIERQGQGRVRAWHNLGQTFDANENLSASEALRQGGMTYRIGKFPLVADMTVRGEDGQPKEKDGKVAPIRFHNIPEAFALIREPVTEDPEPRFFGQVGKGYTLLQNTDLAEMIDRMATGYTVETIGALGQGETIFFALSAGRWDIRGDEIEDYLLVSDNRSGNGGVILMNTPIRVVCQNTLNMAVESGGANRVSLSHGAAVKAEIGELLTIFNQLKEGRSRQHEALEALTGIAFDDETAKTMIEAIYPTPEKPAKVKLAESVNEGKDSPNLMKGLAAWESARDMVETYRAKTFDLYEIFNVEHSKFAGTGYSLYNAVVEHEDFFKRGRSDRTRAESAVFGDRASVKVKAFELIGKG